MVGLHKIYCSECLMPISDKYIDPSTDGLGHGAYIIFDSLIVVSQGNAVSWICMYVDEEFPIKTMLNLLSQSTSRGGKLTLLMAFDKKK